MPLVYWGTGWFTGIALAAALHLPLELLLMTFLIPFGRLLLSDRVPAVDWPRAQRP